MSDTPQGEDWWRASDLKWYPPESRPGTPSRRPAWLLPTILTLAVALLTGTAAFAFLSRDDTVAAAPVVLEPLGSDGPDPFTTSVAIGEVAAFPEAVNAVVTETIADLPQDAATGTLVAAGGTPGLYGGSGADTCDAAALSGFLTDPSNSAKAAAWASAMGVESPEITGLLDQLTSTVLTIDTRVTNNGYSKGRATQRQSILQAGTAVMVDRFGVPRVRCSCGNPLSEPSAVQLGTATFEGQRWSSFDAARTTTPRAVADPLDQLTLVNVDDGVLFERPVGTAPPEPEAEPEEATGNIVITGMGLKVRGDDGSYTLFSAGEPNIEPAVQAVSRHLGEPTDRWQDDVCAPVGAVEWGGFSILYWGTGPSTADGSRASLTEANPNVTTVGGVTVGTPMEAVRAQFPEAPAPSTTGFSGERRLLDPIGDGAGVVVQGTPAVTLVIGPHYLEQMDDC